MLAILDYKAGNQTSVRRALEHLQIPCAITTGTQGLETYDGIIFPGVGAAAQAMNYLKADGLDAALKNAANKGQPILGICLGSQILLDYSEESNTPTLGILPGKCRRFPDNMLQEDGSEAKIPHMGWNSLKLKRQNPLMNGIPETAEFYFVHSYYVEPDESLVLATTTHGMEFCSFYGRDGLWAVQFHPEKSGRPGLALLENFNLWCRERANAF